jgi:heme/copper-type cytochrome/quinol oxidase subunit 4
MFLGENSIYWWARHHAHMGHHDEGEHKEPGKQTQKEPANHSPGAARADVIRPDLDVDEEKKISDWLFPAFAAVRGFVYFGLFGGLVFWMWRNARAAEYDPDLGVAAAARDRQKYVGSVGLFVFAITLTWIATDWVMSLEKTFNSSMFPVIMFDNAAVIAYSVGLLTLLYLKGKGDPRFQHLFPATEQIHLGSLLLAFTLAWTYFNFSQYMLIWIGNLPEEIPYYLKRTRGGWGWYAALAVVFHFPIPFLLLLFRRVKSSPSALRNISIMLIVVVFFDVMWWISPSLNHAGFPPFHWLMDVAAGVFIGGFWMAATLWLLKKHPLLPSREVYLLEAYHHGH